MAKQFAKVGIALSLCLGLMIMLAVFCFRRYIAMMFTKDEQLLELISQGLIYLACLVVIFDSIFAVLQGTARSIGFQLQAFFISMISFYLIAIPLAYYLVFH